MGDDFKFIRVMGLLGTLGLSVAMCVVGGVYGGIWLDRRLGTGGMMVLVGLFMGLLCGAFVSYRMIVRALGDKTEKDDDGSD